MTRVRRGGMKHYENAIPTNAGIIEREQAGHVFCRIKSSAVYRGVPSLPTFGIGSEAQSTNRSINRKKRNLMVPREVHVVDSSSLCLPFGTSPRKSEFPWTSTAGRMLTCWCEAFPKQDLYSRHARRDCGSIKPSDGVCGPDA